MGALAPSLAGLVALAVLSACGGSGSGTGVTVPGQSQVPPPTTMTVETRLGPTTAEELEVELDPDGRPYDVQWASGSTVETRFLTRMHFVDGEVRVMDGGAFVVDPSYFAGEGAEIDFSGVEDLRVSIVWETVEYDDGPGDPVVLGVRLDVPGTAVAEWGRFEFAYGTDGGVGAVTSQEVVELSAAMSAGEEFVEENDYEATHELFDLDGSPGVDSMIFSNGFGDGGFPLTRGYDETGEMVAVMIWDYRFPWRLAVPDGTPPPDVTEREDQLQECLDGTRPVTEHGECSSDP